MMHSNFIDKLKESAVSIIPVMFIVCLLHLTIAPLGMGQISQFLVGGFLLIIGLGIFLAGADLGLVPFGQKVGSSLTKLRSLTLILLVVFAIGLAVTIAEPDVQVLATQVNSVMPSINKTRLIIAIALGVGLFVLVGILRLIFQLSLRLLLIIFYSIIFIACLFIDPNFVGIAFDSGGATTGPVTVPFIMAMGLGVAATIKKVAGNDNGFGLVALAGIGPIAAVLGISLLASNDLSSTTSALPSSDISTSAVPQSLIAHFSNIIPHVIFEIFLALAPIVIIFIIFQIFLLKLPRQQIKRIGSGLFYTFLGLVLFMTGVTGGFVPVGHSLGMSLGTIDSSVLIGVGLILGAMVVYAEPAVWVLTDQVETLSGGHIRKSIMLTALSLSVALAVALGMIRVVTGLSIWYFLIPGYLLALGLTRVCPPLFTAVAFDSGGVASGPMATAFILSLTLGASVAVGGNPVTDAFGMVALIAMAPLVTIQLLGLVFTYKQRQPKRQHQDMGK